MAVSHSENTLWKARHITTKEVVWRNTFNILILVLAMEKSTLINGEALGASLEVTLVIEQFLNETYRFRRNILNRKVEFAILPRADETAEGNTAGCSSSLSSGCLFN